jgi:hypothetical protein
VFAATDPDWEDIVSHMFCISFVFDTSPVFDIVITGFAPAVVISTFIPVPSAICNVSAVPICSVDVSPSCNVQY